MDDASVLGQSPRYRVALADGSASCEVGYEDTLLSSMLRAGLGMPYECNAGGCGSCKFTLIEGEVEELLEEPPGLRTSDRRKNKRLACVSRLRGDCVIDVKLDPVYEPRVRPELREAVFCGKESLTHDLSEFRFKTKTPARFLPGQYAKLHVPGVTGPRSYSMSNTANEEGLWTFQIKRVEGGAATSLLFDEALEGSSVLIDAPYSIAHLQPGSLRPVMCIGGGSGLGPMVSILRGVAQEKGSATSTMLYYGARTPYDVVDPEYFRSIPGFDPAQQYRPVVSEPGERSYWSGATGFIHEHLAEALPTDCADIDFFIAGPPPMVEAVRRYLVLDRGVAVERLHYDRFF